LGAQIGIATGVVVVGDLIGQGEAQERAIVGEAPNLAVSLQALAEPNAIVIADSTRAHIGALFAIEDLASRQLHGSPPPHRAWRIVGESRGLGRFEALRSANTPLVGREEEIALLLRRWAQAKSGEGHAVLLSGEPGVGKSRLSAALEDRLRAEPHFRLRYFCSPHHQDSALYPIIGQLERAAGFERDDDPETRFEKLETLIAAASAVREDVALLAGLLSLPGAKRYALLDLTPQRRREKTFDALLRQLTGLACQKPGAGRVRGSAMDRSDLARAARSHRPVHRRLAGVADRYVPTRVSATLDRPATGHCDVVEPACSAPRSEPRAASVRRGGGAFEPRR
jgi:hypothetical protein